MTTERGRQLRVGIRSLIAGTVMHGTHLPLRTWFLAAYLLATHSNGMSACNSDGYSMCLTGDCYSLGKTTCLGHRAVAQSRLAGEENGRLASTTKMASSSRSVVPPLNTSIGVSAPCPVIVMPASVYVTPCGVF